MAHAGQEVGPGAGTPYRIFLRLDQGPVTPLKGVVFLGNFPGPVRNFLFQLAGIVLHGSFSRSQLRNAVVHVFQVFIDNAHHGADFVFPVVFRNRQAHFFRRTGFYLAQGIDHVQHGAGEHKIENGQQHPG